MGGPAVRLCGWPSGRRVVGPNFYNKIVSPLRALTRARARFVNLIVGVVIQKNDWLKTGEKLDIFLGTYDVTLDLLFCKIQALKILNFLIKK